MSKIADLLRLLADNPDDLSSLPDIIAKVEAIETSEGDLMDKVDRLHEANKRYLKMVTVNEPKEEIKEEEKMPTLDELARMMVAEKE